MMHIKEEEEEEEKVDETITAAVNSSEPLESILIKMSFHIWSQFHIPVNVTTISVALNSPVWEHFNSNIVSQGLQMRVYGVCDVSWNGSSWSQWLKVILWCFQNCMICHKIVCSYLGKAMFIRFISDTLKNHNLQSIIQLNSDYNWL